MAVVAVTELPVGIDLERRDRARDAADIASMTLSSRELAALRDCSRSQRSASVLEAWTRKEAYLKGVGVGLARDPRTVEFVAPGSGGWRSVHDRAGTSTEPWWICSLGAKGEVDSEFVAALAVTPHPLAVQQLRLEPAARATT